MNALTPYDKTNNSLQQRINFIQLQRQKDVCQNILDYKIDKVQGELQERASLVAHSLLERQHHAEKIIDELIQDISSIEILEAAQYQSENLSQTLATLQQTQNDLTGSLNQAIMELKEKKTHVNALKTALHTFSQMLNGANEKCPYEKHLFECGKKLSVSISQNMK
jgi:chromosome segregation ATPase